MGIEEFQKLARKIEEQRKNAIEPLTKIGLQASYVNSVLSNIIKPFNEMKSQFPFNEINASVQKIVDSWAPIINQLKSIDFDRLRINLTRQVLKDRKELIELFYQETIFPPLYYLESREIYSCDEVVSPLEFIDSPDLKSYYIEQFEIWKVIFNDEIYEQMIDEIHSNFEADNFISVYALICIMLESLFRKKALIKDDGKNVDYTEIKKLLKENVFDKVGETRLFDKFIANNLYARTAESEEFSRHHLHGYANMMNKKAAMNVVFIFDFLQFNLKHLNIT